MNQQVTNKDFLMLEGKKRTGLSMDKVMTILCYVALITVVILRDTSVLTPLTILCAVVVLVCGILAAADFRELFKKNAA